MKAFRWIWQVVDVAMALILAAMIAAVFANVVMRYGFASGLRPAIELSRLGFVWLVLLGAAVVLRRGHHLAVDEVSAKLFPNAGPLLERIRYVVVTVACIMLVMGSFKQMNANWGNISQITGLPTALNYLAGVVAGLLMSVIAIARIIMPGSMKIEGDDLDTESHS